MKLLDFNTIERKFFNGGNPLKKLLKISLDLFEARQTGVLFGTNHTKIKFLPTSMWDRGIMGNFDGKGIGGLILKLFGAHIVTAKKLSPVFFFKKKNGQLSDNDGIIAYVLRNCANYYKKGIRVIICPDTDQFVQQTDEKFLYIPFFAYDGNAFVRHENAIKVDAGIMRHFKSINSIYIYLPDYGVLVINTVGTQLLELKDKVFVNETELKKRLDGLIQLVEMASLAYLGQLTGKKGAQLLWRKEKHLRETSHELIENERRYRDLYENAPIAYISLDPFGAILKCNKKAELISGYESRQLIGQNILDLFIQDDNEKKRLSEIFNNLLRGMVLNETELQIILKDGTLLWVSLSVDAIKNTKDLIVELRMMILDISSRKSLEKQLIQSQKMEAIGTLASGIAHDFNNILSPISGYSEMLLMDMEKQDPRRKNLDIILDCVKHAKDLVSQILTFSMQKEHSLEVLDVSQAVKDSMILVRSFLPATIKLNIDIDPSCKTIFADPIQLHQVIMNLVANAYHAMKDGANGNLDIIVKNANGLIPFVPGVTAGNQGYVCLSVKDTGTGIKKEVLGKIFEPYFSTRDEG
ncbi:MAG: PAS domain S-box protein, partial [Desulfobacula sp.]|nr:PAS domain S-box protein [Desulfobacula sp.]